MPIYQSSILLAPNAVIRKIEGLLKKFIWEGGKGNEKKIHLIRWDKIQRSRDEGGLQIRNLTIQNQALGAKLLWQIISGKESWSKAALRKNYFTGTRKRCLDSQPPTRSGSQVYNLCRKALDALKKDLYWIPRNGKSIKFWEDSILGETPIGLHMDVSNLKF